MLMRDAQMSMRSLFEHGNPARFDPEQATKPPTCHGHSPTHYGSRPVEIGGPGVAFATTGRSGSVMVCRMTITTDAQSAPNFLGDGA